MIQRQSQTANAGPQSGLDSFSKVEPDQDPNIAKLRLAMALFRLRPVDVAKATGYSKTFLSLVMSGRMRASSEFFMRLNGGALLKLISESGAASSVFEVAPSRVEVDEATLNALKS